MSTRTQRDRLREWLKSGHPVTPLNALQMWGCMRLGARVLELRREGLDVKTTMVQDGRTRYARYHL
jgi:hypothetical protein